MSRLRFKILREPPPFYRAILSALGPVVAYDRTDAIGFGERNRPHDDGHSYLAIYQSSASRSDSRCHSCFRAQSTDQVERVHRAGLAAGGTEAGALGYRTYYDGTTPPFSWTRKATRLKPYSTVR